MLVLSRKKNESVVIGEGPKAIVVTLLVANDGKARLGFQAPDDEPIFRMEVYEEIHGGPPPRVRSLA